MQEELSKIEILHFIQALTKLHTELLAFNDEERAVIKAKIMAYLAQL